MNNRKGLAVALLAGLLVAGAGAARAEGRIAISRMTVQSCRSMGKCHWRLTCRVGKEEAVQEMQGVSRDTKEIGKMYDTPGFPVNVQCTTAIDDGWIGTSWKEVGKADVSVPGGGDYDLVMENKEKGGVKVLVTVDSLEIGATASAPAPAAGKTAKAAKAAAKPAKTSGSRQFLGVFQGSPQGTAVLVGMPWDQFKARADQLDAKGSRIVALDTYLDGGRRLWSGVFRSGDDKQAFLVGLEWTPFLNKWKDMTNNQHMRLVDLALYDEGSKRLLGGAFREGYDENTLWVGQEQKPFEAKVAELGGQGQRLLHMEVYRTTGNKLNYAGAFRKGTGSYGLWTGLDRDAFLAKWKKASAGGSQLNEVKTYVEGKKRLFDGVIGGGGFKTDVEIGLDWAAFAAKWKEEIGKGMRLVDVETYQD